MDRAQERRLARQRTIVDSALKTATAVVKAADKSFGRPRFGADGSIQYPRRGWEPPPPIKGYTRDPKDKWRFLPLWVPCASRLRSTTTKSCGAINVFMVCNRETSPHFRSQVDYTQCAVCPVRDLLIGLAGVTSSDGILPRS